jgi:hypothetical protein
MTARRYFVEIGFRYLGILPPTVAIGYVLRERLEQPTMADGATV